MFYGGYIESWILSPFSILSTLAITLVQLFVVIKNFFWGVNHFHCRFIASPIISPTFYLLSLCLAKFLIYKFWLGCACFCVAQNRGFYQFNTVRPCLPEHQCATKVWICLKNITLFTRFVLQRYYYFWPKINPSNSAALQYYLRMRYYFILTLHYKLLYNIIAYKQSQYIATYFSMQELPRQL